MIATLTVNMIFPGLLVVSTLTAPASEIAELKGMNLARVCLLGDLPPAEKRAVVAVDGEGTLSVDGKTLAYAQLRGELTKLATPHKKENGVPSELDVVLGFDADLPWRVAQMSMQAGADPQAAVYRLFFAVRGPEDEEPGALAAFLPQDRGLALTISKLQNPMKVVQVKIAEKGDPTEPRAVKEAFAPQVVAFKRAALADGRARAAAHFGCSATDLVSRPGRSWSEAARAWAAAHELEEVVCLAAPVGPWQDALRDLKAALTRDGRRLVLVRRAWDEALWPRATRGYFAFKKDLEATVGSLLEAPAAGAQR